ncbi:renin receptor-like [Actinia tenebrosa]|uniref:Renin receptor-like n=1 Tax=Actinia tenebrosa TaxID=6105 RepID=A0A6P8IIP4_ACTTE|nr:renin receptor-like [Actinia tenebrosa]
MADQKVSHLSLFIAIFLVIFLSVGVLGIPNDVRHAFIIKEPAKATAASMLSITHAPNYVSFLKDAGPIPSNEISSINTLALGFSVPKDLTWAGLMAGDMFRRPKARILIAVDGVLQDDSLNVPAQVSFPIQETDEVSGLDGMLSQLNALKENLATHISKIFGGRSLTLSVSADPMLAAFGSGAGMNSHTMHYNQDKKKFLLTDDDNAGIFQDLQRDKNQILSELEKNNFGNGVKFSKDSHVITVAVPGQGNAVFDLNKQEDFLLFAEVQIIFDILQKLQQNPDLVNDNVPDILTFSLASLKAVRARYGKNSLQAKGAVVFLSAVITKLSKGFADLYNGNALVEVLTTEWNGDLKERYPEVVGEIFHHLEPHLASDSVESFSQHLPSVNFKHDMDNTIMETLCDSLHNKLLNMQSKLKVDCLGSSVLHRTRRDVDDEPGTFSSGNFSALNVAYNYTPFYSIIFNIWLWLFIALVLTVYVIALVLWYMDPGRDSIIYRMTSQRMKTE